MSDQPKFPVIELFGPTIQGEGLLLGVPTHFLRLGGCGFRCKWCDSMHAVLPEQVKANRQMMSSEDITHKVEHMPFAPWVTVTGGDPCMHKNLGDLFPYLWYRNMKVAIETQGEFWPDWLLTVDVVTFSPKGPSSGMDQSVIDFRNNYVTFRTNPKRAGRTCVKVVVFTPQDLAYAFNILEELGRYRNLVDLFCFQVGSPLTTDITETIPGVEVAKEYVGQLKRDAIMHRYEWLVEEVLKYSELLPHNVSITPQQHTLLWPTEDRGR